MTKKTTSKKLSVGILMPDGSIQDSNDNPRCRRCNTELEWTHLDNLGQLNFELYGVVCWDCLHDYQVNTARNGY